MKIETIRVLILSAMVFVAGVSDNSVAFAVGDHRNCKESVSAHSLDDFKSVDLEKDHHSLDLCNSKQSNTSINSIEDVGDTKFASKAINSEKTRAVGHNNSFAIAQASILDPIKKPLGWSALDLSTPSSPAAAMAGYKGEIGAISNPNEIAVKLLNGLNSDGKFQTGFAIDIAPYLLARGTNFTLEDYRKENAGLERFLARTKISIATAAGENSTSRLGLGAEFILINDGDPRLDNDLLNDFKLIVDKLPPFDSADPEYKVFYTSIKPIIIEAKAKAQKRAVGKPVWKVGVGTSLISTNGSYFDFRDDGTGLWTTFSTGLGGDSQLILHGYYRGGERVSDRELGFLTANTLTTAARIRTGSENFKFSLEASYNFASKSNQISDNYIGYGLGVEPKITDKLWLSLSIDGTSGKKTGSDVQIFSGLKWNFNSGE